MNKYTESSYAGYAAELIAMGFDCTALDSDQMDIIGMAAERGALVYDRAQSGDAASKNEMTTQGWTGEQEVIGAYVEGMWGEIACE